MHMKARNDSRNFEKTKNAQNSLSNIEIPWVFPEFPEAYKFPENSRFSRFVATLCTVDFPFWSYPTCCVANLRAGPVGCISYNM